MKGKAKNQGHAKRTKAFRKYEKVIGEISSPQSLTTKKNWQPDKRPAQVKVEQKEDPLSQPQNKSCWQRIEDFFKDKPFRQFLIFQILWPWIKSLWPWIKNDGWPWIKNDGWPIISNFIKGIILM